jgi:hypothetical protein
MMNARLWLPPRARNSGGTTGGEILWDRKLAGMTIRLTVAQEHLITE